MLTDTARPADEFGRAMYTEHFGFNHPPFSLTPDPHYFYASEGHREAFAHLRYGILEGGGFVQLTGDVGTGKTTVCRYLLRDLPPEVDVALILNPRLTAPELLSAIGRELGVAPLDDARGTKALVDALEARLLDAHARGRRTVLIVDEAQNLSSDVLEQIRLLTNLETETAKLLQIILIGQPELADSLAQPALRQVSQRITARYHLRPFGEADTCRYIGHRLERAGRRAPLFRPAALRAVHRISRGIPRLINVICDRALLGAYGEDKHEIDVATVRRAAAEVLGRRRRLWVVGVLRVGATVAAVVALGVGAWTAGLHRRIGPAPETRNDISGSPATVAVAPAPVISTPIVTLPADSSPVASPSVADPSAAEPPIGGSGKEHEASPSDSLKNPTPETVPAPDAPRKRARPPARSTLADLLADQSVRADKASAFVSLFARWGFEYHLPPSGLACDQVRQNGLRCLFGRGSWNALRALDVPAILELTPTGDNNAYATLLALEGQTATLAFHQRRLKFPVREIESVWNGAFIAVWRPPALAIIPMAPGLAGPAVSWLRQRLRVFDGGAGADVGSELYDDALKRRVAAFQRRHGLRTDGVVGEETLAQLTALVHQTGVPRLVVTE